MTSLVFCCDRFHRSYVLILVEVGIFLLYSRTLMRSRWFTAKAVFLLLSIAACSANAAPPSRRAGLPEPAPRRRGGQTLARSDFDADGLMDEATLTSWGPHSSGKIVLSRSGQALGVHLDNGSADIAS